MGAFKIFCNTASDDWMVQFPSGKVQFVGGWGLFKLIWQALSEGKSITIVDKDGSEEEVS